MKRFDVRVVFGLLLVGLGGLFLLQNFELIPTELPVVWVLAFGVGGLAFLYLFFTDVQQWWPLIPGFALLGLAALIGFPAFFPWFPGDAGAALFLGMVGLSFILIFVVTGTREWWALIPGGALVSVAALVGLTPFLRGEATVGVMMLGLALTFAAVALLAPREAPRGWAWIPAGILGMMGWFFVAAATRLAGYIIPLALILGGGYFIFRSLRGRG